MLVKIQDDADYVFPCEPRQHSVYTSNDGKFWIEVFKGEDQLARKIYQVFLEAGFGEYHD